ncbi:MAG TPA: hypothetical protein VFN21_04235 [Acidimicrobiales bacterium]|nr:hypothetical protein [Acidimicrobiales bacterium]
MDPDTGSGRDRDPDTNAQAFPADSGSATTVSTPATLHVEFCDEWTPVDPSQPFLLGREGDIVIDENPYLHRSFLELAFDRLWWLRNVGSTLSATVSDDAGAMHAWLAPGSALPLVFPSTEVRFTAGPTNYMIGMHLGEAPLEVPSTIMRLGGTSTLRPVALTDNQRMCVLALSAPTLERSRAAIADLPSNADAARSLGWTITKFNRQLDAVCSKLDRAGVRGLHGGYDQLATNRRARLVEYALAVRLVTPDDLVRLAEAAKESS